MDLTSKTGNEQKRGTAAASARTVSYPKEPVKYKLYDTETMDDPTKWTINNVHDPAVYKDGEWFYIFSTDMAVGTAVKPGIQVRKSKDLINWEWVGHVFDDVPKAAKDWSFAEGLWAPDIGKMGDIYYLYYAASTFGTNQSFIGVATAKSIEGPWTDQGEVVKTQQGDISNAIDPNIAVDADGKPWMDYGSFFGGIYILPINPDTGKPAQKGIGDLIARRYREVSGAVEGPYIIYNSQFKKYYLFVSYDSLFSDYNVRVGRADKITGPYLDYNGRPLILPETEAVEQENSLLTAYKTGNKILAGYQFENDDGWLAPGHNSILKDNDNYFIIHHARGGKDKNWAYLHVRRILWTDDGWPVVSPERYSGESEQKLDASTIEGTWECIRFESFSVNEQQAAEPVRLLKSGKLDDENGRSYWEFNGNNTLKLYLYDPGKPPKGDFWIETVKVITAWDWENWKPTLVFTGIDQTGISVWGKKR